MSARIFRIKDRSGDELRVKKDGTEVLLGTINENRMSAVVLTENQVHQLVQELNSILLNISTERQRVQEQA